MTVRQRLQRWRLFISAYCTSRNQRDFLSRSPKRRARVQAVADQIIAELETDRCER